MFSDIVAADEEGQLMADQHIPVRGAAAAAPFAFESEEPPFQGYYCHCTICQRAYGGFFSATLRFRGSAFRFTKGEPKHYRATNFATRSFCADCGSPMPFLFDTVQDVWIKIGTLDHPEDWPMTKDALWGHSEHWHTDTKIAWEEISDGLPQVTSTSDMRLKAAEDQAGRTSRKGAE